MRQRLRTTRATADAGGVAGGDVGAKMKVNCRHLPCRARDQPELQPVYAGPTPADPFGGRAFDIFDVMDQAERAAEAQPASRAPSAAEILNNTAPEPERSVVEPQLETPGYRQS